MSRSFCDPRDDVKQLSTEKSASWGGCTCRVFGAGISSRPVNALLKHSFETLKTSWERWTLAASSPGVPKCCFPSVSWAFSRTDCKYFPCASILSCRCLWTCDGSILRSHASITHHVTAPNYKDAEQRNKKDLSDFLNLFFLEVYSRYIICLLLFSFTSFWVNCLTCLFTLVLDLSLSLYLSEEYQAQSDSFSRVFHASIEKLVFEVWCTSNKYLIKANLFAAFKSVVWHLFNHTVTSGNPYVLFQQCVVVDACLSHIYRYMLTGPYLELFL